MKKTLIIIGAVLVLFAGVMIVGPFFVLNEGEQAVVVRFGQIVKTHTEAGLKFRSPFVDDVIKYPKRLLSWDGEKQRIPTKENQFIWVDTTARWRISDPVKFYESVSALENAYGRLGRRHRFGGTHGNLLELPAGGCAKHRRDSEGRIAGNLPDWRD